MARAAVRKGNLATRIRDELGQVYDDEWLVAAFGARGRPGISPLSLMIVSVLQFSENLTDQTQRILDLYSAPPPPAFWDALQKGTSSPDQVLTIR